MLEPRDPCFVEKPGPDFGVVGAIFLDLLSATSRWSSVSSAIQTSPWPPLAWKRIGRKREPMVLEAPTRQ